MILLTVKETAEALTVKPKTIWTWIALRRITTIRLGRCVRVPASECERLLAEGLTPHITEAN